MPGITPVLMRELNSVLSACNEFMTTQQLHMLFVDRRLYPFGRSLPTTDSIQQRIDSVIYHLHNHYLADGSNGLVNLLEVLKERYIDEYLGTQLYALAGRLRIALSQIPYSEVEQYITAYTNDEFAQGTQTPGLEQIIAVSNLKEITWLQMGLHAANCVCRLLLGDGGRGTGFLVSSDLLMTNNHVLPNPHNAAQAIAEFNYQLDYTGGMKLTSRYHLDAARFKTNIALDYTLVGVEPDPSKKDLQEWGYAKLNLQAPPTQGEHVIIIQHPGGEPKQIALTENYVKSVSRPMMRYTTDTRPGSSGAPVFNDGWQVIALHHRSVDMPADVPGKNQKLNEGILLSAIADDAQTMWPTD